MVSFKMLSDQIPKDDAMLHPNNLKEMVSDEEYYLAIKEVE